MKLHSKWVFTPAPDEAQVRRIAALAGVSPIVARLLAARGVTEPEAAKAFLTGGLELMHDPRLLPDMDKAAARVARAVRRGEKVAVYGDYDVDGQTSTALLVRGLSALGLKPDWYIPERVAEGYGLNGAAVDELARAGVQLLITVDCGIQGNAEVERARAAGMDVIITDDHGPGETLPPAAAVVNPKRRDSRYPFRELAGVGVAYKLLEAVYQEFGAGPPPDYALELAALGTVADVCPLVDENRVLVRAGLDRMNRAPLPGVAALMDVGGLRPGQVSAGHIGFVLGPRLNAAGRVSHAAAGVRLLLTDDPAEARRLAEELDAENEARRRMEADILEEALARIEQEDMLSHWVLVVDGEGWHPGVIGIVASRLVERYARPAIVIGYDGDVGKGSGRSIERFDLFEHLRGCADVLEKFGGHQMAAGLTVRRDMVPELRRRLNAAAAAVLGPADLVPETRVDLEVALGDVTEQLARELEQLAPFGAGNPTPVLAVPKALVVGARAVGGDGDHLKLTLRCPEAHTVHEAIGFGGGALLESAPPGSEVRVAFTVRLSEWQGRPQVEMQLKALQSPLAQAEMEAALGAVPQQVPAAKARVRRRASVPVVDRRGRAPAHDLARVAYMATLSADGARVVAALGAGEPAGSLVRAAAVSLLGEGAAPEAVPRRLEHRWAVLPGDVAPAPHSPWPHRGHFIVFGLPARPEALWAALMNAAAAPGWTVHLAYDEAAVARARRHLERRLPGKEALRAVYRVLAGLAARDGLLPGPRAVAARMDAQWPGLVDEGGVLFALDVFEELQLLRRLADGRFELVRSPGRVDVESSLRYNDGVKTKQLFGEYSRVALEASPAHLIALAAERSSMDGFAGTGAGSAGLSEAWG